MAFKAFATFDIGPLPLAGILMLVSYAHKLWRKHTSELHLR